MPLTVARRKWSQLSMATSIRLTRQLFHWLRAHKYCYYYYWIEWGFCLPLFLSLPLSCSVSHATKIHACRLFKNEFQFPFLPRSLVNLCMCCAYTCPPLCECVQACVWVRVCFCRSYGNQYLNSVRSFSPCCVRLSLWTFKNKIQTHSTRSTTQ